MKKASKWISVVTLWCMLFSLLTPGSFAAAEGSSPSGPELFVTEILPDNVGTDNYEYFEVYNNSNQTLLLNDYTFLYRYPNPATSPDLTFTFAANTTLGPQQLMVFWYNNASPKKTLSDFNNMYGVNLSAGQIVEVSGSGFSGFANTASRTVVIKNKQGTEISKSTYAASDISVGKSAQFRLPASGIQTELYLANSTPTPGSADPQQLLPVSSGNQPPVIEHTPVTQGQANADLTITASVYDPDDTVTASVYYKLASQTTFTSLPMSPAAGSNYTATIAKSVLTEPELNYYIQAKGGSDTVTTSTYSVAIELSSFDYSKVPGLLVTELVPDSSNVGSADGYEFIEIYNNTPQSVELRDYKILYRYTNSSSADGVWELPGQAVIPPGKAIVLWIMNGSNNQLTAADFNANYGTALVENTELVRIDGGGGMANGGKRKIVVASKAGVEVSEAYYDNDEQTVANKGVFYRYPVDGSNRMSLQEQTTGKNVATPGSVEPALLPAQPAGPLNKLPVIEHTPVTKGSVDQDLPVSARITDPDNGTVTAVVYYKPASAADFQSVAMTVGSDHQYSASIPKQVFADTELQYFLQVNDGKDTLKTVTYNVQMDTGSVDYSRIPPLLVTELVPDSSNVGSADGYEFIEIYNNTDQTINFKDYKIQYRYTDSGPDADVVWPTDREDLLIPSRKTLVFWVINSQNTEKTVADFNALYGTNLVENTDIVKIYSGGMANGGKRGIVIATNTRTEISAAYYDTDEETVANKGIFYKYAPTGASQMIKYSAGLLPATPGKVEPVQVPIVPATLPVDTVNPTFNNLTDKTAIDQSENLEIVGEAHDENRVKTVALFYKTNQQAEFTKRYLTESFADTYYHYKVYAPELIGREYLDYYFVISDGKNEITTGTYRVQITGGMDHSDLRLNVKDGDIFGGTRILKGTSEHAPASELRLSIDQDVMEAGVYTALEQDAYFAFDVTGVNYYFKNGVTIGQEILYTFDDTINDFVTLTVPIQADRLKNGSNVISIRAGTKASPFDDRKEENKDDFDVRNVRLVLADGTELYDSRFSNRDAVIKMGDSEGKYPVIDFDFVIPAEKLASKAYAWDTRQMADGNHTITISHPQYGSKTAQVRVDNTAPDIAPTVEEGKSYRGAFTIDATVTDALSGVLKTEAWLDDKAITLPYSTSSSQIKAGVHTLRISATDQVGNVSQKDVHFETPVEDPAVPELVTPASGQTGVNRNAVLAVKVADPLNDKLNVSFFQGFKYDAAAQGAFSGFRNAVDVEPPKTKAPAGETPFAPEDYERVRSADGVYLTDDAVTKFPYQRFQVQLDASVKDTDLIELEWKGNSLEGRKVSMYVWSPAKQKWMTVDDKVAGKEDFELGAWIKAGDYAEDRMIQVLVQDELPVSQNPYDFSFVWMSDTQYYSESYPYIYEDIVKWIADNKESNKIKYVIHTGDIVDEADKPIQWQRANDNMKVLENAGIPYGVLAGNHDVAGKQGAYDNYWQYFGEDRFKSQLTFGESIDNNRGHYDLVSSDGNDFIFIYMGWGIRDSDIDWMNEVLAKYPDRKAVLNFHEFLLVSGNRAPIADKIFEQVVKKNKNVFAVLSGHYHDAELLVDELDDNGDGVGDRKVYQMLADYQGGPEGGQGYIRLLQFDIANNKMHVKTYSPYMDDYNYYDPAEFPGKDEFSLDVDLTPKTKRVATDYMSVNVYTDQLIGKNSDVSSGQQSSVTWRDLAANKIYGWYAVAEDAFTGKSMSDIWKFVTGDGISDLAPPIWTNGSLAATNVGKTSLRLSWTGASDNVAVTQYKLYKNGTELATVSGTEYEVTGLTRDTGYTFKVEAGDAAGNWSTGGPEAAVRTRDDSKSSGGSSSPPAASSPAAETPAANPVSHDRVEVKGKETTETRTDGTTITKVTVSAESLNESLAMIAGQSNPTISIKSESQGNVKVELPASSLANIKQNAPGTVISIQSGNASYDLPLRAIDLTALAQSLGVDVKDMKLSITMEQVSGDAARKIEDTAKQTGIKLLGSPVDFSVSVEGNGKMQEVNDFGSTYVSRTILIPQTVDREKTTVLLFDPDAREMAFVPARFTAMDGKTVATVMRNGNSIYAVVELNKTFVDMSKHWAKTDVELMASKLIVKGISEEAFGPDQSITRAEFAAMIVRALGITENKGAAEFRDVSDKIWFAGAVGAAVKAGLVEGFEDGSFKPDTPITREQMAVMVGRALNYAGKSAGVTGMEDKLLDSFKDKAAISEWARAAVTEAVNAKIIEGMDGGAFVPSDKATRAQAAVMIKRMLKFAQFIDG
ncbi:S-layer homology domain-containing protein [Paenibacillus hamazuiensis]|uniref:S-layer homology domain-containing protein n=1 Tax=Paenibacillus hamazuiensis TaxID=2936508 RepID=UPI0020105CA5|nr:S-layer homology domain-containing protein [Paenibacillus hamazuiensis]